MSDTTSGAHQGDPDLDESSTSSEPRSPDEIEAELEQTRRELTETVDALTAKLDVKSRARDQVESTKHAAAEQLGSLRSQATDVVHQGQDVITDEEGHIKPAFPIGAAILVALGIAMVVISRRRKRVVVLGVKAKR